MFTSSLQVHGIPENPIPGRLYNSLQDYGLPFNPFDDHGIPVRPVPGVLYDSLQDHGIPENPIPGRVYCPFYPFPDFPILP